MYSSADLIRELTENIEQLLAHQKMVHPNWITQAYIEDHNDLSGTDSDCALLHMRLNVRNEVRRLLSRFKLKPDIEADPQLVLPGFKRLQRVYLVTRDGEQVGVPVDNLTNKEIDAKCAELLAMSDGCLEHVKELRRYMQARAKAG